MLCSHCHSKVDPAFKYCPNCGTILNEPLPVIPASSTTKKKMPIWFQLISLLAVLALIGVTAGILFTESWVDTIDYQLEALRENNIDKAYFDYTSKEFKATTSLDQFRHFVETYPVFLNNQSAHFSQRSIEHHVGTLKGNLTSNDHVITPIEYKLIKEEGKWRILSIRLLKPGNIQNTKEASHGEDLIEVAKSQLKDIQDQKITEAYQEYSSKEFKEATSEAAFQEFIKRYPILSHYHIVSFHKPSIHNGIGTLSVILQSDQIAAYAKYYLIFEEHKWKIWSMRILSPSEKQENKNKSHDVPQEVMTLGTISLDHQNETKEENLSNTKTVFPSNRGDLYVDIEVKNGLKGSVIDLNLEHIESGSSIPAQTTIEEGGDSILMSVFSPPSNGWPKGRYNLKVTTSSGLSKSIDFDIE